MMRRRLRGIAPPGQLDRYVSMNKLRIIAAFILAPLMTPLTFIIAAFLRGNPLSSAHDLGVIFVIYTPFAYLAVLVFGIPAFFLFRFLGFNGVIVHLLAGAAIGLVVSLFIFQVVVSWSVARGDYAWCAVAGGISALMFWLIAHGFVNTETTPVPINGET
jgi:hypothetical protein